jgi:hypothetical protein
MKHRIVLWAAALGVAWLYVEALVFVIGIAMAKAPPAWWGHVFAAPVIAVITWTVLCHTTAILIVAFPFAYVIARIYGRVGIVLAMAVTVVLYAMDPLPAVIAYFNSYGARMKIITLFDALKLLGTLPVLVWLFNRMTSKTKSTIQGRM